MFRHTHQPQTWELLVEFVPYVYHKKSVTAEVASVIIRSLPCASPHQTSFCVLPLPITPICPAGGSVWLMLTLLTRVSMSPCLEAPLHTVELFHISEFIMHICRFIFCYLVILPMIMLMWYSPEFSFWSQIVSI